MKIDYYEKNNFLLNKVHQLENTICDFSEKLELNNFLSKRKLYCDINNIPYSENIILHGYEYTDLTIDEIKSNISLRESLIIQLSNSEKNLIDIENVICTNLNDLDISIVNKSFYNKPIIIISKNITDSIQACEKLSNQTLYCLINVSESISKW